MKEKNQEKLKLLQPKNDFVFQSLFSEKNKEITKEIEEMETKWKLRDSKNLRTDID